MLNQNWRIEMMGGLRLIYGNKTLTHFKSQKVAGLVAYLAFYSSRCHTREELQLLLWPDDSLDAARNSLRVALSLVRKQLDAVDAQSAELLCSDRQSVWLDRGCFVTDTGEFDASYGAALHTEDEAERARILQGVVSTFSGELLPGFHDEWVETERNRLNETHLQALRRLVRCLAALHDYERALEYAREAARIDPLREEAVRDVMRLFTAVGQPSAALQHYTEFVRLVLDTFQSTPSAATRDLAKRISDALGHSAPIKQHLSAHAKNQSSTDTTRPTKQQRIRLPQTRFFGREPELARLAAWLSEAKDGSSRSRLVTITGPAGTGKTRLSVEACELYREQWCRRVFFVPLADLTDARNIVDAILEALQAPKPEVSGLLEGIASALGPQPALLVLDNFEHLVQEGAPLVRLLLEQIPAVTCIVTSRRSLRLPGEREFPLLPLPVPVFGEGERKRGRGGESVSRLMEYAGVQLFVDRAQAVTGDFCITPNNAADVAALCGQLEGLPLAIEIAAARIRVLTPAQMLTYLGRRLDLLINPKADKDGRHRSLRAATEWSYRLLTPDLRRLFARLSVFEGGWSLEAASTVCEEPDILEGLEQLRADSLIQADATGSEMRFRMLEILRSFASEHLSPEDRCRTRSIHADFFLEFAEHAEPHVKGPDEARWMDLLQTENDNLRTAFEWFLADTDGGECCLRLVRALWRFWSGRGYLTEGRERAAAALSHPTAQEPTKLRALALMHGGDLATSQGDFDAAKALFEQSLELFRRLANRLGIANALGRLGVVTMRTGDYKLSRTLHEQSLQMHQEFDDSEGIASATSYLGLLAIHEGEYDLAWKHNERCLSLYRDLGNRRNLAMTLGNMGLIAENRGDYNTARGLHEESLAINRELGTQQGISVAVSNLAMLLVKLGDYDSGRMRLLEGIALFKALGIKHHNAVAMGALANIALLKKDWEQAGWYFGVAEGAREAINMPLSPRDQHQLEENYTLLREELGDEAFELALTRGQATDMDKAIDALLAEQGE